MLFSSFKQQPPPIAVDFGVARLKVLQLSPGEADKPAGIIAAAARSTPAELIDQPGARLEYQAKALGDLLRSGGFKGKRAVCSVSAPHTVVQHMQVTKQEGKPLEPLVNEELRKLTSRDASQFILRHTEVCEVTRGGAKRTEVICLAMPREIVIAHMKALNYARLDAVGIHAEHTALVKALGQIAGTGSGASGAQLLVDLGAGSTKLAVAAKGSLRLAKVLSIGGRQLYRVEEKAAAPACAKSALRAQLAALESDEPGGVAVVEKPAEAPVAALHAASADALSDEIQQCVRYYHALAPDNRIERAVFVGGESAKPELCKRLAKGLGAPAQVADVLSILPRESGARFDGLTPDTATPEWAVALGLCLLPTEA